MNRGEIFDAVFDAVYEAVFEDLDVDPDGDMEDGIDWDENIGDYIINIKTKVTIEIPQTNKSDHIHTVRRVSA